MATSKDFIDYIMAQMESAGYLRTRKMFGEYAIYRHDKVIAFACDNKLLFKDTPQGRACLDTLSFDEVFPGSAQYLYIEDVDDADCLVRLAVATDEALPPPKPKKPRKSVAKKNNNSPK